MGPMKPAAAMLALGVLLSACSSGRGGAGTLGATTAPSGGVSDPSPSIASGSPGTLPTGPPGSSPGTTEFLPDPNRSIPRTPAVLAEALVTTSEALRLSIDAWTQRGDPSHGGPPDDVILQSLYEQRIYRLLARHRRLAERTIPLLPSPLRREAMTNTTAASELFSIVRPISHPSRFRTGAPRPAGVLLAWFKKAQRRFGVDWQLLAAVMYVESKFGRVRSNSSAGAQGPMQFISSTWSAYGMGGDVHDPHDAIMGAANYLHRSGSPGNDRRALYAYNHSWPYVNAVLRYTDQMRRESRTYFAYYSWQVFVLTTSGDRRITGPGL
jgi:hypothetical protein